MEKPENYIEETKSKLNTEMRSNTLQFIVIILGLIWLVKSIIITIFDISKGIEDKSLSYSSKKYCSICEITSVSV